MSSKVTLKEWIEKANNDWTVVKILLASDSYPLDIVCFHCQQYVEKMLKGLLCLNEMEIPKTHDIRRLIHLTAPFCPELASLKDEADKLSVCAVISRYPDAFSVVTKGNMDVILVITRRFADILLPYLMYDNS